MYLNEGGDCRSRVLEVKLSGVEPNSSKSLNHCPSLVRMTEKLPLPRQQSPGVGGRVKKMLKSPVNEVAIEEICKKIVIEDEKQRQRPSVFKSRSPEPSLSPLASAKTFNNLTVGR